MEHRSSSARLRVGAGRSRLHAVVLAAALLGPWAPTAATAQTMHFSRYGIADGLPQSQVNAIHQDREGFLWIGTYGGATQFDGQDFRTLSRDQGLASNTVLAITEDALGRLVIGVRDGACVQLSDRFRCLGTEGTRRVGQTNALVADPTGGFWLAASGGLLHVDSAGRQAWSDLPRGGSVTAVARDSAGGLWVASEYGLFRRREGRFVAVPVPALGDAVIHRLRATPGGIVVATERRILRIEGGEPRTLPGLAEAFSARISDVIVASDGTLLIATVEGAFRYRNERLEHLRTGAGVAAEAITTISEDRDGTIWLGTESGIIRVTPSSFDNFSRTEGLPHAFVRALAEDSAGRLWVGTRAGIAVLEGQRFRAIPLPGLDAPRVYGLAVLSGGGLLVAMREGLLHYDDGVRRIYGERDGLPEQIVVAVLPHPAGGAWVGTRNGIVRWQGGSLMPVTDTLLRQASAESMAYDDRGRLWVGLGMGGVLVHDSTGTRAIGARDGLSEQSVWTLRTDHRGGMWVGTNGDGAFHVDSAGGITRFDGARGLVNPFVWQILAARNGRTWFYTNQGLTRRDATGTVQQFGLVDGLVELEGSANASLEMRDGSLWFGTGVGLSRLRAGVSRLGAHAPPVVRIHAASIGTRDLPLDRVQVGRTDGALQVRFTAAALRDAASIRFRYRFVGDGDWTDVGSERSVTFAGLAPGRHLLEVRALDARGVESPAPDRLMIQVLPAFWQTFWFRGLIVLAILGAATIVPALRARRHEAERVHLEELVRARTDALRESEERLRAVVEHSTNLFFSYTTDRELLYASPQSAAILGMSPAEMRDRWRAAITDHPANAEAARYTERAIATGEQSPPYEMELRHASGSLVWVQVNEAPVVRDGRTVAMVGSLTNITDEKAAQLREARLADQLRQSQKLESIGRLTGGIAHDFNNLLTAVVGHAELLAEALPPESTEHEDVTEILRASGRAGALVSQLMAFSRQQIIKRAPLDLNVVIQESARLLDRILGSDITLVVQPSAAPAWILADQSQVDQILLNLVSNSRDAMPKGGRLEIATTHVDLTDDAGAALPPGRYVALRVSDTGIGMDEETRARVFEPFFTTKGPGEGTGLGLATVYGIASQNGWHIELESQPGRGATFQVRIPATSAPARTRPIAEQGTAPLPSGDHQVVLVAEDEEGVRSLVCRTLRQYGYQVLQAPNGDEAVAIAESFGGQIDLLLTDVVMPGMSGKDTAESIGRARPRTRVLFMTGHSRGMLGTRGILTDATNVLNKPFRPQDLVRRVQEVLQ